MYQAGSRTVSAAIPEIGDKRIRQKAADDGDTKNEAVPDDHFAGVVEPDFPPESFWLSEDAEYDWFDRNAVYERKESMRGNSSSNNVNPSMNCLSSQRSSVKSTACLIGLPKPQKTAFADLKWRGYKAANTSLFLRQEKLAVPEAEPGSPKVSCMGRVRSKSGRRRTNSSIPEETPAGKSRTGGQKQEFGFCAEVMNFFQFKKGRGKPFRSRRRKVVEGLETVEPPRRSAILGEREIPEGGETVDEPLVS